MIHSLFSLWTLEPTAIRTWCNAGWWFSPMTSNAKLQPAQKKHLHWEPLHCYLYVFLKSIKYLEPVCPLLSWFCTLQKKVLSNANNGHQRVPGMYKCIHSPWLPVILKNTSPEVTSYQKLHRTTTKKPARFFGHAHFTTPRHMCFVNPETFWCCRTFALPPFRQVPKHRRPFWLGEMHFFFRGGTSGWMEISNFTTKNHKS